MLVSDKLSSNRGPDFLKRITDAGIDPERTELWKVFRNDPDQLKKIKNFLRRKTEFIFVDYTEYMPLIFEAAFELGMIPGKDFIVTGIASGVTFSGLFPKFPYFRIPRYKIGLQLMQSANEIIRGGRKTGAIPKLKVEFIETKKYNFAKRKVYA